MVLSLRVFFDMVILGKIVEWGMAQICNYEVASFVHHFLEIYIVGLHFSIKEAKQTHNRAWKGCPGK